MSSIKIFSMADSLYLSNLFSNKDDVSLSWRPLTQLFVEYYGPSCAMVNSRGTGTSIRSIKERQHIVSIIKEINKHGIPGSIKRRENHQPQPNRTQLQRGLSPLDQPDSR